MGPLGGDGALISGVGATFGQCAQCAPPEPWPAELKLRIWARLMSEETQKYMQFTCGLAYTNRSTTHPNAKQ